MARQPEPRRFSLGPLRPIFVLLAASCFAACGSPLSGGETDFDQRVAPLLARRCVGCHSANEPKGELDLTSMEGLQKGGESGPVVVPGNAAGSLLWERVASGEMPPKERLSEAELAELKHWIQDGAKWGAKRIDPFEFSNESRAGRDWWSLQPVPTQPQPPHSPGGDPGNSPIDLYIRARLAQEGLSPSPEAGSRDLARRLHLDLLGLPAPPELVDEFVADGRPDAWERLADRLLASPHFGERWARHWLDIIRFGESQGFERDKLRTNAWRYRDWVVDAFNRDLPYDQFTRQQLAGDVLEPKHDSVIVATGFLVAGAYDEVGQSQQSAAMRAIVRQDELEDIIAAVGQTFLGLTVNCSRCHDHKFDPIPQKDYYQLSAALGGVWHGERELGQGFLEASARDAVAALQQRSGAISAQIENIEQPAREAILAERRARTQSVTPPAPIASWEFRDGFRDELGGLHGTPVGNASLADGKLVLDGGAHVATAPLGRDLGEKTLEAWVQLENLGQRGGGVISLQTLDGHTFDAIVFGEQEPGVWMAGSNGFVRTRSFQGPQEREAARQPVHVAIAYHADGTIAGYRNGKPYGEAYRSQGLARFRAGEAQLAFGLRHAPPGGNRLLQGAVLRARLYDRALKPDEIAASAGIASDFVDSAELAQRLTAEQSDRLAALRFEREQVRSQIARWQETKIYAVVPKTPEPTFVLKRGQTTQPGELVAAAGIQALQSSPADWKLGTDASDAERRRRLSEWVAERHNPLFSRVIVNRLWHYHFGAGIVETTNDFGFNGTRPTHPELLDWLADSLWRGDGHLKPIHRAMVVSATYRQASGNRPSMVAKDAANRLLWRKEPLRLDAEVIRDSMLAVAGDLNRELHGPGFYDFTTFVHNTQFYEMLEPTGPTFQRRSLYRTWVRSGRNNFLDVFDCPDPSTKTPARAATTTPLQSLALLNSRFSLRIAERMARELESIRPGDLVGQVEQAMRRVYGRGPDSEEVRQLTAFAGEHGLAALCRVLFNSNEFLYSP